MKKKYPLIDRDIERELFSVIEFMNEIKEETTTAEVLLDMYCFYTLIEKYIMVTTSRRNYIFISTLFDCITRLYPKIAAELNAVAFYARRINISEAATFVRNRLNFILDNEGE